MSYFSCGRMRKSNYLTPSSPWKGEVHIYFRPVETSLISYSGHRWRRMPIVRPQGQVRWVLLRPSASATGGCSKISFSFGIGSLFINEECSFFPLYSLKTYE
ncbi:hypothetical protein TNIN_33481 [Trichonephila inaurata madagascariensis]|uniref:Uncharacterized protein n=1 Tax=Trichonephila inaurata madagascariensis TaxID=2747483 RepID=A0A8X7CQE0_9ARAC|nr:hypothetical protein TNIN_33481 [Trichonephila inaurata madagascariensis]